MKNLIAILSIALLVACGSKNDSSDASNVAAAGECMPGRYIETDGYGEVFVGQGGTFYQTNNSRSSSGYINCNGDQFTLVIDTCSQTAETLAMDGPSVMGVGVYHCTSSLVGTSITVRCTGEKSHAQGNYMEHGVAFFLPGYY